MGQIEDKDNEDLEHVIRLIGFHPEYLKYFLKTQHYLLRGDGPLPYDYRHYIAIMASARHQCTCLINHYKHEFSSQGGNSEWLKGLDFIPQKLRDLNEINKLLAHTPWLLKKCHIEHLTKGKDSWSIGELVQAVVLLAHFHCLCSFVSASTILSDSETCEDVTRDISEKRNSEEVAQETVEELMEKMTVLQQREELHKPEMTMEFSHPDVVAKNESDLLRFIEDPSFIYKDSVYCHDHSIASFQIQDCSWDGHAYSLLNQFYNDVGTILDEKFKVAYDLTYYTMGHKKNVDTTIFRRAVWNYIHKIFRIIHDDYDYTEVEELLEHSLRSYIETVCFFPERITKTTHDGIMRAFRYSEKVHVNLMLFEARLQAELLYALSAINQHMT